MEQYGAVWSQPWSILEPTLEAAIKVTGSATALQDLPR